MVEINDYLHTRSENMRGVDNKFWLNVAGTEYLYKYTTTFCYIGEVFCSHLFSKLGLNVVDAQYAQFEMAGKMQNGALIKSFRDQGVEEILSYSDIAGSNLSFFAGITPKEVLQEVKSFVQNREQILGQKIFVDLKDMECQLNKLVFVDQMTDHCDRHAQNIEFLIKRDGQNVSMELAPVFDNGRCFNLHLNPLLNLDLLLNGQLVKRFKYSNMMNNFEYIAKNYGVIPEITELVDAVRKIDIGNELSEVEQKNNLKIPFEAKLLIQNTWKNNVANIDKHIAALSQPQNTQQVDHADSSSKWDVLKECCSPYTVCANYYMDKQRNENVDICDYIKQMEALHVEIEEWADSDGKLPRPDIKNYPLLRPVDKNGIKYLAASDWVDRQVQERSNKIKVPRHITSRLVLYQALHDLIRPDMSFEEKTEALEKAKLARKSYDSRVEKWLAFGDDYAPYSEIFELEFDECVKEKFATDVINFTSTNGINKEMIKWLRDEGFYRMFEHKRNLEMENKSRK